MTIDSPKLPSDFTRDVKKKGNGRIRFALMLLSVAGVGYLAFTFPLNKSPKTPLVAQDNRPEIAPIERMPIVGEARPDEKKETIEVQIPEPQPVEKTKVEQQPLPTIAPQQPAEPPLKVTLNLPDGEAARTLIAAVRNTADATDYEKLYHKALLFQQQEKHTDAFLLYFFSAREGHDRSALKLGEMNDPAHFTGEGDLLEAADPSQAYKWYRRAAEGGLAEAEQRLSALRSTTEAAAASGDNDAQRLLLNWK
ncbi:MAG: deoxyribonuclease [Sedimenticola sp.]